MGAPHRQAPWSPPQTASPCPPPERALAHRERALMMSYSRFSKRNDLRA